MPDAPAATDAEQPAWRVREFAGRLIVTHPNAPPALLTLHEGRIEMDQVGSLPRTALAARP